ncbi:hypothetical protein SSUR61_0720 [Streptococcus suis R61]|uniref:Uncharacterized protein n=1 Tax=Streptococcus suis R61 TaxID=996306 RepID=A0AA87F938_STRSU|nr:hypothetical protein SSUR61_0720 [Streptococcus suis R61]
MLSNNYLVMDFSNLTYKKEAVIASFQIADKHRFGVCLFYCF